MLEELGTQRKTQSQPPLTPVSQLQKGRPCWGHLRKIFKLNPSPTHSMTPFESIDICGSTFTIGRSQNVNWIVTTECAEQNLWPRISKIHCKITKDDSNMENPVFIEDLSVNGTYVNYEKIGVNNKRILKSNDVISFVNPIPNHTFFEFIDNYQEQHGIPVEIFKQYYIGKELGSGAQGAVRLVIDRKTCKTFAMKIVKTTGYDSNYRFSTVSNKKEMKEAKILNDLEHPNIIGLSNFDVNGNFIYMFLDFMAGGDLRQRINLKPGGLPLETAKHFFKQLCAAVDFIHDKGYVHRDIKPENILLESDEELTQLKLSDFGLSKMLRECYTHTICGTSSYMSPEIIRQSDRGIYTNKVDVWGLGVVLYAMLSGRLPFESIGDATIPIRTFSGSFNFDHHSFLKVPKTVKDLIRSMLTVDPNKRPSVKQVMMNAWFTRDELEEDDLSQKFGELVQPPCKKRRVE